MAAMLPLPIMLIILDDADGVDPQMADSFQRQYRSESVVRAFRDGEVGFRSTAYCQNISSLCTAQRYEMAR